MSKFDSRCPMKGSKLDVELANLIQTLSPYAVSWYRSYYDFHKDENDPFFDDMETEEQVNIITTLVQDLRAKDEFKKDCEVLGKSNKSRSYLYSLFAETIPSEHRLSIIEEVASEFTSYINRQIRDNSEYKNMSRVDVVSDLGVDNIFREVRDRLCKNRLKFADIIGDYLNDDNTLNEEALRANTNYETANILAATKLYNKEQRARIEKAYKSFSIINNILETPGVWTATIFLSKQTLLNTERVKLGHESEFSAFIDKLDDLAQEGESFEGVDSETNIEDAENETLEHWMLKADTISALSGISAEIRTFLNTVMVQDSKGILGFASRIDVGNAYLSLLKFRVESGASNSEDFIDYLNSKADEVAEYLEKQNETPDYYNAKLEALKNTGILYIMDTLEDKNNSESKNYDPRMYYMLKTLLFTNFNKACCNYTIVEYKTTDGHKCSTIEINLGDFNSISETVNAFQKSIKELELQDSSTTSTCVFNNNGRLIPTKINTVSGKIRDWLEFMKTNNYDKATKCDLIRELNNDILLDKFVDINIEDLIEDTEESNERFKEFLTNVRQLLGELAKNGGNVSILSKGSYKRVATALEELLKTETIYPKKRTLSFEGCTRFGDSTYFNNTNKFALSVKMEEIGSYLKSGDRDGLKQYLKEEYLNDPIFSNMSTKADSEELSIHHDWLEQLYNWSIGKAYNRDFIEVFKESTIIRGLGDKNGYKEWKEFNETENFRFTISHFMSSYIEHKGTMGLIPTFVLGDADSVRFIPTTVLDCSKAGNYKAKFIEILRQELIDIEQFNNLADYFAEHDITGVSIFTDRIGFSFFPALHEEYSKKSSPEARAEFVDAIRADLANGTSIDIFYDKWIKPSLDAQLENFITLMRGKEMADKDGNLSKSMFPENYTSRIFEYNGGINSANKSDLTALEIIFLNFKFGEIQHIRMSSVSPLFYAGTEDMQKRWKEIIASGNTLDLSATDASGRSVFTIKTFTGIPAQRVGYFKDFSVNTYETDAEWQTFLETVGLTEQSKELYGKGPNGRKSSVTDGQAYRSFESYRAIKIANGEWYKDPNNEKVFNIIMGARARGKAAIKNYKENNPNDAIPKDILEKGELTKDEWREIIDSKVIFQPIKPFYYGLEKVALENGIADIPVQHKYAEIVLIPELLPIGHTMRKLGFVMDEFAYDMLASTKCVKVGGFDYADIDIDTIINGDQETINKAFTREETVLDNDGNPILDANNNPVTETIVRSHILGLNGYVMQTNVPYHGNTFRGEGTQIRKILGYTGTIEMSQEICKTLSEYGEIKISEDNIITTDVPMKGTDLQELFTALECAGWCKSIKDFTETVRDPKKLSRIIENSIANDSKSSNDLYNSISFVEEDGITRKIPLSEGIFSADIMAQLLSILRKRVVKQDTHGGTAVQIAPLGMDLKVHYVYEDSKPVNIDYVDGAISFDFTITNEYGKTIELDYLKYVDPRTGKLYADNGKDTVDDPEDSMLAHEYPKILNFLMYRVPTERAYSTIAVKATRFFPKTMGGVVALPTQYTTIAGFDFKQYWSH